jgi:hypothetical protein
MFSMNTPTVIPIPAEQALNRCEEVAALYADVFATEPWNEAMRCTNCSRSYGVGAPPACIDCNAELVEYYPLDQTTREIRSYFSLNRSRVALALENPTASQSLCGFAWGWEEPLPALNDRKLALASDDLQAVLDFFGQDKDSPVFYFSEFGVRADLRGLGLGKLLYRGLLRTEEQVPILMRTSRRSPAFSISTRDAVCPLKVIYDYRDSVSRVLLASSPSSNE